MSLTSVDVIIMGTLYNTVKTEKHLSETRENIKCCCHANVSISIFWRRYYLFNLIQIFCAHKYIQIQQLKHGVHGFAYTSICQWFLLIKVYRQTSDIDWQRFESMYSTSQLLFNFGLLYKYCQYKCNHFERLSCS